jgi:NlpC/P60 family protein
MVRKPFAVLLTCICLVVTTPRSRADQSSSPSTANSGTAPNLLVQLGSNLRRRKLDCSHFVHALYQRMGFAYQYATSRRLYKGFPGFARTNNPSPGDLVVWRGHVGIVLQPKQHTFLSSLNSGIKVSSYASRYWAKKGEFRFLQFVGKRDSHTEDPQGAQLSWNRAGESE